MQAGEIELATGWAADEGWNPGLHDAGAFLAIDPQGFLLGLLDGEPMACISAVNYDDTFGFLGFYIVKPDYRGNGYGLAIWNAGMSHHEQRNVGLDGVPAQQHNYAKSGFVLAHRNVRYEGTAMDAGQPPGVVDLSSLPFAVVAAFDRQFFPAKRDAFLKRWIALPASHAIAAVAGDKVEGYGVIRQCRNGYKIGPLFAENEDIADDLFTSFSARVEPGAPVFLDVPEENQAAVRLAERHAMHPSFETARMYSKVRPALDLDRVFGITTFELG